ncbi:D-3-phosphoglycerate dehydrogenase [Halanaerobium saccharolyticum]|uniref:D-3-phosphoglycerate dehydrogenase n=1 Tax=Halanaerobium saccharolyticum TaxID=43595 RepID=A0A4R6LZ61_9FIRM|nr:phosphoglycerate dehydrogenase [Halanaerobium saccharolyticum]TDO94187.1 D-3-phosphoglycerate dehydrogenase [Halanaerobium saccharolyticum]
MSEKILITPKSYYKIRDKMMPLPGDYQPIFNDTGKTFTEKQMLNLAEDVVGIIIGVDPISRKVIENASKLKAISKYGVGMDNIDLEAARNKNIKLDNTPGTNNVSVAELALGLIFAAARNIPQAVTSVKEGEWKRIKGTELTDKTLGLMGCGKIGREVVKRAAGIFKSIQVYDPYFDDNDFIKKYKLLMLDKDRLLQEADFVSLHLPLNKETENFISRKELSLMKGDAVLVNTSRGGLIDEAELYKALKNNELGAAACDVFSEEPPGKHQLLELDNFLLTPHMGANTKEAVEKMAAAATRNLIAMLEDNSAGGVKN